MPARTPNVARSCASMAASASSPCGARVRPSSARACLQHVVETVVDGKGDGRPQRRPQGAGLGARGLGEHLVGRLLEERIALVLVEDDEARRHAGLEREPLQQPLAEGVDGLHLEAAGRLDGDGEQLPRPLHLVGRWARGRAARRACASGSPRRPVTHSASRANTRLDISAAAAFVYVSARMRSGGVPPSSRRSTRMVSTCVLPVPALALTQAEAGSAIAPLVAWLRCVALRRAPPAVPKHRAGLRIAVWQIPTRAELVEARLEAARPPTLRAAACSAASLLASPPRSSRPTTPPRGRGGRRRRSGS